ncbi:MAG: hypothetical protein CMA89_01965 [Euryarchaeota archaeon]|nr:hypothetical protein [Euryarchaeota archaeon]
MTDECLNDRNYESSLMQIDNIDTELYDYEIAVIGAGGIGSNLLNALVPALHRGELLRNLRTVRIRVHDSDRVDESNLAHQKFNYDDIGSYKVRAIEKHLSQFTNERLTIEACPWDIRDSSDMLPADLTIVAVDSAEARRVVHSSDTIFLDLRCLGDSFIALDTSVDSDFVSKMTPDQKSQSCQYDGAIESGNIQFGYLIAAAHGAQWVLQTLRWWAGQDQAMPPPPQSASITLGTLGRMPEGESVLQPQGCIKPQRQQAKFLDIHIETNDYDSPLIKQHVASLVEDGKLQQVWSIGDQLCREISILIDAAGKMFVDVGESGQVKMAPPEGAVAPFQQWIHTHPKDPYWSKTDRDTLACFSGLLTEATVLGESQYLVTRYQKGVTSSIGSGPLSNWSSETTLPYARGGELQ